MIAMQKKKIVLIGGLALGIAAGFLFSGEPAGPLGGKAIDSKHPIDEAESTNSRQAVPRMTNSELYLQSEHDDPSDPRSVTYDPIFILKATGKAPFDVFEAEPFNKQWAEPMRAVVTEHFVDDLDAIGAQVEVESAECRTSSCKVTSSLRSMVLGWLPSAKRRLLVLGRKVRTEWSATISISGFQMRIVRSMIISVGTNRTDKN